MKTLGRIFIILTVMAIVMGITYAAVSAGGSSSSAATRFEEGRHPPFREGQFEGARPEGRAGGGWMFGLIKNVGVIAVLVTLVVLPKSIGRKRKRTKAMTA